MTQNVLDEHLQFKYSFFLELGVLHIELGHHVLLGQIRHQVLFELNEYLVHPLEVRIASHHLSGVLRLIAFFGLDRIQLIRSQEAN